ncbi:MAG: phage holin family protein [Marinobacterium sp.]|nr:phage holin family protein [Marinobacterium sp.]
MIDKDPTSYPMITYLWVIGLASWGGVVRFYQMMRASEKKYSKTQYLIMLLGELAGSALAGLLTFYLCELYSVEQLMTAVLVAVSGHAGAQIMTFIERFIITRYFGKSGISLPHSK